MTYQNCSKKIFQNLTTSIPSNGIEAVKNPTIKKVPRPKGFTVEFYQNFK
jgi:hypothetical protein